MHDDVGQDGVPAAGEERGEEGAQGGAERLGGTYEFFWLLL